MDAKTIIAELDLLPHPEGGHYREIHRSLPGDNGQRGAVTSIYFLLQAGEVSHWHRVDATEIWHFHAGADLELKIAENGKTNTHRLGTELEKGVLPQAVVPPHAWQSAKSLGDWSLVGCTVAPAFEFDGFELAPEGWQP